MTLLNLKSPLNCICAVLLTWAASDAADAGAFYYAGYAPASCCGTYYTGYAPLYGGYYGVAYRGYGAWGASYASYYAPSCCGSACGAGCYSCGGCSTCGVSYGACGTCCDTCGLSSCSGCGIACATGCDTGAGAAPAATAPNQAYSPPAAGGDEKTFAPDAPDETKYSQPKPTNPDSAGSSGGVVPIVPGGGRGVDEDFPFRREVEKPAGESAQDPAEETEQTVPQRQDQAPAAAEPSDAGEHENRPPADENVEVLPVEIDARIAAGAAPVRSRVHYTVRFRAPHIARLDINPNERWTPVDFGARLAATK